MTSQRTAGGRTFRAATTCVLGTCLVIAGATANANGLETPENGAIGLGRAGAVTARGFDPSAIISNVAGLLDVPGFQLSVAGNVALLDHCFQATDANGNPAKYPTSATNSNTIFENDAYLGKDIPKVCKDPSTSITPYLAASFRPTPWLAFGIGAYGPHTTGSNQSFASTVMGTSSGASFLAPSPARHLIYSKSLLLIHPTFAVAIAPVPWLRFGAAIQPSFASFSLSTMVNTSPSDALAPASDIALALSASGFVMAGTFSLQVVPTRWLSFGASFHLNGVANMKGSVNAVANPFSPLTASPKGECSDPANLGKPCPSSFTIDEMNVPLPWNLRVGARFAVPRGGFSSPVPDTSPAPVGRLGEEAPPAKPARPRGSDPMRDEVLDIEADFYYEHTSQMSKIDVKLSGQIDAGGLSVTAPPAISLNSQQSDSMGIRVGGDINAIPGIFTFRAGAGYDTGSQSDVGAQLHLPSYNSTSLHVGASLRLPYVQFNMGFGHFFFQDFRALNGSTAVIAAPTAVNCMGAAASNAACQVNRGIFNGHLDVVSVTATMMIP